MTPPGGTIVFSAAQLHSTVPNTTEPDALQHRLPHGQPGRPGRRRGAPNIDSECTGTTLRDFLRASDLEPLPEEVIAAYDKRPGVAAAAG